MGWERPPPTHLRGCLAPPTHPTLRNRASKMCRLSATFPKPPLSPFPLISQVCSLPLCGPAGGGRGALPKLPVTAPNPASSRLHISGTRVHRPNKPSHLNAVVFNFFFFRLNFGLFFLKIMSMTLFNWGFVLSHPPLWMKARGAGCWSLRPRANPPPFCPGLDPGAGSGGREGLTLPTISPFSCPHPRIRCLGQGGAYTKLCFLPEGPREEPQFPV